jgi:cystathionine beta-lyase family protein involved in aluminum resistance
MVLAATAAPHISDFHYRSVHGGSFWSGLRNVLGSVASGIQKVAPIASMIAPELAPLIGQVSDVAGASGRLLKGSGRGVGGSRLVGGGLRRR